MIVLLFGAHSTCQPIIRVIFTFCLVKLYLTHDIQKQILHCCSLLLVFTWGLDVSSNLVQTVGMANNITSVLYIHVIIHNSCWQVFQSDSLGTGQWLYYH